MQFKTFYWFSHYGIRADMPLNNLKYGKRTRQLKFMKELKHFRSRNNGGQRKTLRTCLKKFKQERLQINQLETFNFLTVYKPYTKPYAKKDEFETFIVDKLA